MTIKHPALNPEGWRVWIGGEPIQCLAEVVGIKSSWVLDKKEGDGIDGGTVTGKGRKIRDWQIKLTAWDDDTWRALAALVRKFATLVKLEGFAVYHPLLELHGVRKCFVEDVDGPVLDPGGKIFATLVCCDYRKPPKANVTTTPKGGTTDLKTAFEVPKFSEIKFPKPGETVIKP